MNPTAKLKELTGHEHIILTNRGNTAIKCALFVASKVSDKKIILIPDQGGWLSYKKLPQKFGFEIKEYNTDYGIIELEKLELEDVAAIIITQPAGYFAAQPLKGIYEKCGCLVIADVSGSIGDKELCEGDFADIMVGSFRGWKPVNLGEGGFISFNKKEHCDLCLNYDFLDIDKGLYDKLSAKLNELPSRYKMFYDKVGKIKTDLKTLQVIHRNKKGIVVVVKFNSEAEKQKIIKYCESNRLEYTICPRYIRVLDNAISIEVKRL